MVTVFYFQQRLGESLFFHPNFIQANQYVGFLSLGLLFLGPIDDNDESRTVLKINGTGYRKFCLHELDHHCTRFTYLANCNICLWLFAQERSTEGNQFEII